MVKPPSISSSKLIKILKKKGFIERSGHGSHRVFNHPDGLRTVVPFHPGQIPFGTLRQIMQQAKLELSDF
jgi:predicted RNA binding protein YcfA (HicA-like mRNA interferase family)